MYQMRLTGLLLRPSLFSSVMVASLSGIILIASNWSYAVDNPLLSQYFFGQYGVVGTLQNSPDVAAFVSGFFASTLTYHFLIVGVAVLVALVVYIILQGFSKTVVGASDTLQTIQGAGASKEAMEKEVTTRLVVRVAGVVFWLVYTFFFLNLLLPYSILAGRIGANELASWQVLYGVLAFVLLFAALHLHVIFFRLVLLRPRIFGGREAILEELYKSDSHT